MIVEQTTQHATCHPDDWQEERPHYTHTRNQARRIRQAERRADGVEAWQPLDDPAPEIPAPPSPPDCHDDGFCADEYILTLWLTWQDHAKRLLVGTQHVDQQDIRQETGVNIWLRCVRAMLTDRHGGVQDRHVHTVLLRERAKVERKAPEVAYGDANEEMAANNRRLELRRLALAAEQDREAEQALQDSRPVEPTLLVRF